MTKLTTKIIFLISLILVSALSQVPAQACTGVIAANNDTVLVGNNEDYNIPYTKVWFVPPEDSIYGGVYFGYDNLFPQGGMNEKGLFFDGFATQSNPVIKSKSKPHSGRFIPEEVLEKCATVDEALKFIDQYNLERWDKFMIMICDATGDSAIVEGDDVVRKKGSYQVCTNFYQSQTPESKIRCGRYKKAVEMLESDDEVSIDSVKSILDAVHAEGTYPTQYSNIYDLKNKIVYLYFYHDFENVVKYDLMVEIKKPLRFIDIPTLFPTNQKYEDFLAETQKDFNKLKSARLYKKADPSKWDIFTGLYKPPEELGSDKLVHVELNGGKLIMYSDEYFKIEILPESENIFFYLSVGKDWTFEFVKDASGNVTQLSIINVYETPVVCERID